MRFTWAAISLTASKLLTSPTQPAARISNSAASFWAADTTDGSRSIIARFAPSRANSVAMAWPMPRAAPTMTAVWSLRWRFMYEFRLRLAFAVKRQATWRFTANAKRGALSIIFAYRREDVERFHRFIERDDLVLDVAGDAPHVPLGQQFFFA